MLALLHSLCLPRSGKIFGSRETSDCFCRTSPNIPVIASCPMKAVDENGFFSGRGYGPNEVPLTERSVEMGIQNMGQWEKAATVDCWS